MLPHVARAMRAGLAKAGEPSSLRGVSCGKAALVRGAEVRTATPSIETDNYVGVYDLATIDVQYSPEPGDLFVHPEGTFKLDALVSDNGVVAQFIVVAA